MAPLIESFPPSQLEWRVQQLPNGKRRKGEDIDLEKCELLEMVQYSCVVAEKDGGQARVKCYSIERLFRKYVVMSMRNND